MPHLVTYDKGAKRLAIMRQTTCTGSTLSALRLSRAALDHYPDAEGPKQPYSGLAPGGTRGESALQLSKCEAAELRECETILERGLGTFLEVGNSLLRIRENRLYRVTHQSFQQYCLDRWSIGRIYAWRLIGAAERINLLPDSDGTPRPSNEFQVRPFLKLPREEFPTAWKRALKQANEGKITPGILQTVVDEFLPHRTLGAPSGKRPRRAKRQTDLPKAQILVLLQEARKRIEKHQLEEALAALDNIENVLFNPE
jgi:hypothetical protein